MAERVARPWRHFWAEPAAMAVLETAARISLVRFPPPLAALSSQMLLRAAKLARAAPARRLALLEMWAPGQSEAYVVTPSCASPDLAILSWRRISPTFIRTATFFSRISAIIMSATTITRGHASAAAPVLAWEQS